MDMGVDCRLPQCPTDSYERYIFVLKSVVVQRMEKRIKKYIKLLIRATEQADKLGFKFE